jgi:iron complex outermembrane receptor protein
MDFHDEIIPYGPVNPYTGLRSSINADRTVHAGVELAATVKPHRFVTLSGNISYNYNRVKEFTTEFDGYPVDFADNKIAGFPDYVGNLRADLNYHGWTGSIRSNFIGRRYMELWNIEDLSLDPYAVVSLSLGYTVDGFLNLGNLTLEGRVDNLTDKKYESSGYGGNYAYDLSGEVIVEGWAEYYVAPERSFYGQVTMEMF